VRCLLIAESHVVEADGDRKVNVSLPFPVDEAVPRSFCRLVYCLGYGEDEVCAPRPTKNAGTIQYWDIFGVLAKGMGNNQPRKSDSDLRGRILWKLEALRELHRNGIWLVDACVAGVYKPGGGAAVAGPDYARMVRDSYERFVWPGVRNEPIEQVWTIGIAVSRALAGCVGVDSTRVIAQPQGDRSMPGRHRRELETLVRAVHDGLGIRPRP
jgi:hypothetical protein